MQKHRRASRSTTASSSPKPDRAVVQHTAPQMLVLRSNLGMKWEACLVGPIEEVGQHSASADGESSSDGVVGGSGNNQNPAHADAAHGLQLRYLRVEGHLPEGIPRPIQRPAYMRFDMSMTLLLILSRMTCRFLHLFPASPDGNTPLSHMQNCAIVSKWLCLLCDMFST